jgi:hypothetical protein
MICFEGREDDEEKVLRASTAVGHEIWAHDTMRRFEIETCDVSYMYDLGRGSEVNIFGQIAANRRICTASKSSFVPHPRSVYRPLEHRCIDPTRGLTPKLRAKLPSKH